VKSSPTISVVIPCYNVATFIEETLATILEQSYPQVEILVVNDGSTDETKEVLEPFKDVVRYFEIPNSGGPSRPRNIGLLKATGELVAFCDADDMMLPGKLAAAEQVFDTHPEVDFLFTNFQKCNEADVVIVPDFLAGYRGFRKYLQPGGETNLSLLSGPDAYRSLLRSNFIGTSSVVCRPGVIASVGNFDETMPNSEDIDLWRRIARRGYTFAFLDEVHHTYRLRFGSISDGGSRMFPAKILGIEKQIPHCSDPKDLNFLHNKIHSLWLSYGYMLRLEMKPKEAKAAFRTALSQKINWAGIKGLVLSSLTSKRS